MRIRGGGCGDPFARDLGCTGPPLFWDEERRSALRAELDVFCFQFYGFDGQDTDYVLETSQPDKDGLKNNEAARFGTYRTKELVLETFDREDIGSKKFPGFASPAIDELPWYAPGNVAEAPAGVHRDHPGESERQ